MKKLFTLIVFITGVFSAGFGQGCDTLFNLISPIDTPIIYLADTGAGAGYLSGNNKYGDLIKAERFASVPGDSITSATFFFGIVTINPGDSNNVVKVYVWDNTGFSIDTIPGAPGHILDSATLTLRQIAAAVTAVNTSHVIQGVSVNFTGN